jgi:hypothetical protein
MGQMLWDEAVSHIGSGVPGFLQSLLSQKHRNVLYVAGAGFDPRASHLAHIVAETKITRRAVLVREDRPDPGQELIGRADANEAALRNAFPQHHVVRIQVFDDNYAVIGGQSAVAEIRALCTSGRLLEGITDVIVDMSAMSIGISFPIVGLLYKLLKDNPEANLHIVASTGGPELEAAIVAEHAENFQHPHGFKAKLQDGDPVVLWVPQLAKPKRSAFKILYEALSPREVCPIFPFPAHDPRSVENLLDSFGEELVDDWRVDTRHMLFAAEDDPLDLYRTLSRMHSSRELIYKLANQPAETVLSPLGSKALAIGALLAALEHNLPVAYVEARRFTPPTNGFVTAVDTDRFVHVWMTGEVYSHAA